MGTYINYIQSIIAELKQVHWLSREEAIQITINVLVVSIIISLFLFSLDLIFQKLLFTYIIK